MAVLKKRATIDAPADRVFEVVESPENWPKYVPHVNKALDIHRTERRVGDSFRLIYRVLGLTFDETLTVTEHQPSRVYDMCVEGRMKGRQRWCFEQQDRKTLVQVEVDYRLPGGLFGKALDALVLRRVNANTIDRMFANLNNLVR